MLLGLVIFFDLESRSETTSATRADTSLTVDPLVVRVFPILKINDIQ